MSEIHDIEQAIAALESQRGLLGDSTVEIAVSPLREKLRALKAQQEAQELQLKYVSVLFTDIVGSTQMSQHLEAEDTLEIMNTALVRFEQVVRRHGGRVTRFMGDGLVAVFGIPTTQEDDAERAVQAGLALVQAAGEYSQQLEKSWQRSGFNVRVGISTGQIVTGSGVEEENTSMGMTINLAARMESLAPVGGVLISDSTYQHVRGAFDFQPQPLRQVKGFDLPVQTYHVLGVKPRPFYAAGRGIRGLRTALIGREAECSQLREIYQAALDTRQPQFITILGEAGVGKSRLLSEFESWLVEQPTLVRTVRGRATPQMLGSPFSLLRELFKNAFHLLESDPAAQARRKLEDGLVGFLGEEAQMKAHFIGALLGYDFQDSPHLSAALQDPKQVNQRGRFYLSQFFVNSVRSTPLLVLLEDIQWGDQPSLDFIQRVCESLDGQPALVICLARRVLLENHTEFRLDSDSGHVHYQRLNLQPLPENHARSLVRAILEPLQPLPTRLEDLIVNQAEGNPYYIEELINVLIDDGIIQLGTQESSGKIDLARLDSLRIPATLEAVLQARLDGLPAIEKKLLQCAAVIGRTFWDQLLQIMLAAPTPLAYELASLCGRGLIHPSPASTFQVAGEYTFRQTLLREVAYETVLKRDRQRYHASVAAWLAQITAASGRAEEHLSLIAQHYDKAGDEEQAAGWYYRAGERAKLQGASLQAHDFFSRALELLPHSLQDVRWRALLGRNEVLGILGNWQARDADDQALLAMAHDSGNPAWKAEAYARLGFSASGVGDEHGAIKAYETSITAFRDSGDVKNEARLLGLATISLTRLGDFERARSYAQLAIQQARQAGDDLTSARVITNVSVIYSELGDISTAIDMLHQQIILTHRLGEHLGEGIGNSNLGYDYVQIGMYDLARKHLEEAQRLCNLVGARNICIITQLNLGLAFFRSNDWQAALEIFTSATIELNKLGNLFGYAAGLTYLALVLEAQGEYTQARQTFEQAYEICLQLDNPAQAMDARAGVVRCGLALSEIESTCPLAEQIWAYLEKEHGGGMEFPILAYLTCCDAAIACGKTEVANTLLAAGYQELMERAKKISSAELRQHFLEQVPEHARCIARYRANTLGETH